MKLMDIGDRLNALRVEYIESEDLDTYQTLDIGVKLIIAAALVEMVKDQK